MLRFIVYFGAGVILSSAVYEILYSIFGNPQSLLDFAQHGVSTILDGVSP